MPRIVVFVLATAATAAFADVAAGFRYPVPALAPVATLAAVVGISFALWLVPTALVAFAAMRPVQRCALRGWNQDAIWWALAVVAVLFAALTTWQHPRRLPLSATNIRGVMPALLIVAWACFPAYAVAATVLRRSTSWLRLLVAAPPVVALAVMLGAWSVHGVGALPAPALRANTEVPPALPTVVLITVDTLRRDALSVYEPNAAPTPRLEELASDSLVFEAAVSPAPWTLPSLASLQSGLTPAQHGVKGMADALPDDVDTLAEVFGASGYATGLIGFNPYLGPSGNLGQGFQHYRGYPRGRFGQSLAAKAIDRYKLPVAGEAGDTPGLTTEALEFIQSHRAEPFFLWLHYYDPHQPYSPPDEYMPTYDAPDPELAPFDDFRAVRSGHRRLDAAGRQWVRDLYAGEVRQADEHVGRVLDELREQGLYDDALIVFTSDHGEEFWEHGGFEHGHALYEELIAIPLLVKLPASAQRARIEKRVRLEAVYTTILATAGLAPGDEQARLRPLLGSSGWEDRDLEFVSEATLYYESKVALTRNGFKYIRSLATGDEELYDLAVDPGERHSIAATSPARLADLRARLDATEGVSLSDARSSEESNLDKSTLQRLQELGYAE